MVEVRVNADNPLKLRSRGCNLECTLVLSRLYFFTHYLGLYLHLRHLASDGGSSNNPALRRHVLGLLNTHYDGK